MAGEHGVVGGGNGEARAAEASGIEVLALILVTEVRREEGTFGIAAQRTAERLFTRAHHILTRVLAVDTQREV